MIGRNAKENCCEEAALGVPFYAPCNEPAVAIVGWKGRRDKPIRMCAACMDHNVQNRGGEVISRMDEVAPTGFDDRDEVTYPMTPPVPDKLRYRVFVDVLVFDLVQLREAALARAKAAGMGEAEFDQGAHDEPADNVTYWLGWSLRPRDSARQRNRDRKLRLRGKLRAETEMKDGRLEVGDRVDHRTLGYLGAIMLFDDGGRMAITSSGQQAKTEDLEPANYAMVQAAFELGVKSAGGSIIPDRSKFVEVALDRETIDALAQAAEAIIDGDTTTFTADAALKQFLENISIHRSRK